jgi:hypothetical protein
VTLTHVGATYAIEPPRGDRVHGPTASLKAVGDRADEVPMAAYGAEYDPNIIELAAARLYSKADAVVMGSIATGVVVGAAFGAIPLTSLGAAWPIPSTFGFATLIVGAILGAVIGYTVGDARAFGYRIQAQSALCQLQIERNTSAAAEASERLNSAAAHAATFLQTDLLSREGYAAPTTAPALQSVEPPLSPPLTA